MTSQTARGAFRYPDGADNSKLVRSDLQRLAEDVAARAALYLHSTAVQRPTAGTPGRLHRASDTGALSYDTGTAWLPILTGEKAADSELLDGLDSSAFLRATGKAADSDLLDGLNSTEFLRTTGKAADANLLDGLDSTFFAQATARGTYVGNGSTNERLISLGFTPSLVVITTSVGATSAMWFGIGPANNGSRVGARISGGGTFAAGVALGQYPRPDNNGFIVSYDSASQSDLGDNLAGITYTYAAQA